MLGAREATTALAGYPAPLRLPQAASAEHSADTLSILTTGAATAAPLFGGTVVADGVRSSGCPRMGGRRQRRCRWAPITAAPGVRTAPAFC